ncbi:DUF2798 domain-containing protein [Aestuariibacter sp. A3R04]|uniref:DUF2798 domain-containing protein n=1 Tax=Aestuariibacter sp. A3R04 TaxID=2841571 RepID=UPI001C0A4905|nr:DUF2798 domain-containing protein [Aestuariibacter sp. A3R04]MBU3021319.1 DUF2798 domain-containing protein [Aestuariibacter sp. A3R04]
MNQFKKILLLLPVALSMVALFTGIMTAISIQPEQAFLATWRRAFVFAFLVMLPMGGLLFYLVDKAVKRIFNEYSVTQRNVIHGLTMAFLMESVLALVTTYNSQGFSSLDSFFNDAALSLLAALPIGVAMACTMSLFVKPRLERHFASESAA